MSLIDKVIGNKSRSAVALLRLGPAYCFSPVTKVDKTEFWYLDGLSANDSKQVGPCLLSFKVSQSKALLRTDFESNERHQPLDLLTPKTIRMRAAAMSIQPGWRPRVAQRLPTAPNK